MVALPNTTPEALGTGGTVKFRSPCPVIVEQVGVGNVATLTGNDTFTATETGEYLFENTCDCAGFYEVTNVGDVTDGCCVAPVTDADGALTGITVAGVDYLIGDSDTTYTFPDTVGADGVMTVTDSDGGSQTVTIEYPEDVDIASNSVVGGVVKFVDSNGDTLPGLDIDLNPYVNSPHPTIVSSGDATATFDAATNEWTIGFVDTDTDTDRVNNITVNSDGSVTSQIVDIDGNPVGSPTVIPPPTDLASYASGSANTLAEVSAGAGKAVDFGSTGFLTTNRAVEPSAKGVRNPDGGLGYKGSHAGVDHNYPDTFSPSVLEFNGVATSANGYTDINDPLVIPNGKYFGQRLNIMGWGNFCYFEGVFRGPIRNSADGYQAVFGDSGSTSVVKVRGGENLELVWQYSRWVVVSWDKTLKSGPGYRELETNGTELWGYVLINNLDEYTEIPLPVTLNGPIQSSNTAVNLSDVISPAADGDSVTAGNLEEPLNGLAWAPVAAGSSSSILVAAVAAAGVTLPPVTVSYYIQSPLRIL